MSELYADSETWNDFDCGIAAHVAGCFVTKIMELSGVVDSDANETVRAWIMHHRQVAEWLATREGKPPL